MSSFLQKECDLKFFHSNDYIRKKCPKCKAFFWTLDKSQDLCGDKSCVEFSFIGNPFGKKKLSLSEVRESFLSFFEDNNHSRLCYPETFERCPVIARWRSDIYLTIASIADFQPHVTSGEVPPPANPLVISQPCIRLNDLEEIGISGRHLSMFEMMGHHAFNKNTDEIYWKEQTVDFCDKYFVNNIGIPREKISYKEQLWFGGGNAGPCLEVLAGGLEIATLVFMNMKEDINGDFEIEGKKYSPNPLNIVDTGYGLERISWITQGTPTVYETVFPDVIKWIKDNSQNKKDMTSIYSLADHSKCLAFMLGDGIVPSNVKSGYLARLIIRRSLRFMKKLGLKNSLKEIVDLHLNNLDKDFPSLKKHKKQIDEILSIETKRFFETLSKGEGLIRRIISEKGKINTDSLISLYDTHGMPPDEVKKIAEKEGIKVDIPKNFDSMIAELHSHEKVTVKEIEKKSILPETLTLYSQNHYTKEFDAKILWHKKLDGETEIILDKTAFYPEGGGQPSDIGFLQSNGEKIQVKSARKDGNSIIHTLIGSLKTGDKVHGLIDWDHRYMLMKHHTGTHLVNGALRQILGEHVWQAGSQLGVNEARFDFSHYKPLSDKDIKSIEKKANEFIKQSVDVQKKVLDRNTAEKKFGFRLYQGGVPPGNAIKVLNIPGVDVEACGGTHLNNTSEVEKIRILKVERIQDGVNRVVFAAGKMADVFQKEEQALFGKITVLLKPYYDIEKMDDVSRQLREISKIFSVPTSQLENTINRFIREGKPKKEARIVDDLIQAGRLLFDEWKKTQKSMKRVSTDEVEQFKQQAIKVDDTGVKLVTGISGSDATVVAGAITVEDNWVVHIYDGKKLVSMASENVDIDLREIAPEIGKILGGSGGGRAKMTQCGGPNKDKIDEALEKARILTIEKIKK